MRARQRSRQGRGCVAHEPSVLVTGKMLPPCRVQRAGHGVGAAGMQGAPWTLSGENLEVRDNLLLGGLVQWLSECCPRAGPSATMQHLHVLLALIKADLVRPPWRLPPRTGIISFTRVRPPNNERGRSSRSSVDSQTWGPKDSYSSTCSSALRKIKRFSALPRKRYVPCPPLEDEMALLRRNC